MIMITITNIDNDNDKSNDNNKNKLSLSSSNVPTSEWTIVDEDNSCLASCLYIHVNELNYCQRTNINGMVFGGS